MYPILSEKQLENLSHWKYNVMDLSITCQILSPLWDFLLNQLPTTVAPNLLTLCGLFLSLTIWLITEYVYVDIPLVILFYFLISTLDALDGKQARRIGNSTPFGELFDHSVDIITLFVILRNTLIIYDLRDNDCLPFLILAGSAFCWSHYCAYIDGYLTLARFTGPYEMLSLVIFSYLTSPWIPWNYLLESPMIQSISFFICFLIPLYYKMDHRPLRKELLAQIDPDQYRPINNALAGLSLLLSLALLLSNFWYISNLQIICIFILINAELIVIKMAQTNFRFQLYFFCLACLFNQWISFAIVVVILLTQFRQIQQYLGIPFLSVFHGKLSS